MSKLNQLNINLQSTLLHYQDLGRIKSIFFPFNIGQIFGCSTHNAQPRAFSVCIIVFVFLFQISGIQNTIDKLDTKIYEEINSIDTTKSNSRAAKPEEPKCENNKSCMENKITEANGEAALVPKLSKLTLKENTTNCAKKDAVTLHLELKKAYDYSPPSDRR